MTWIRRARAAAGFLTVVVLLGMFVVEIAYDATLDPDRIMLLVALIAALLGLDSLFEQLPISVEFGDSGGEGDASGEEKDD